MINILEMIWQFYSKMLTFVQDEKKDEIGGIKRDHWIYNDNLLWFEF